MSTSNAPSLARYLALSAAVVAVAVMPPGAGSHRMAAVLTAAQPRAAGSAPTSTSSFYVYGSFLDVCGLNATTECPLYDDAATEVIPSPGGMTILDFGAPCFEPATLAWGVQLFNSQGCTPDGVLVTLAQAWLRGYESNPNRSASPSYVLAAGTSNSLTAAVPGNTLSQDQMALHGREWFRSVVNPLAGLGAGLPSPVTVWAGDDIEESSDGNWYDGPTTSAWVDAYAAESGASKPCVASTSGLMVDYGDYLPNQSGWSPGAVYHVAWQAAPACPMPEIYSAANAVEWQSLNSYAASAGLGPMQFAGVLSEDGAGGSLSSSDSWNALKNATGQAPTFTSVIGTTGPIPPEVPDAPSSVTAVAGPGLVKLEWSAPAWDGGAAVTAYTVIVYADSVVVQEQEFGGFPAPERAIVTGLDDGAPYTFVISATNRVGTGPQSLPSATVVPSGPSFLR